jgi:ribose transport system substrate-binding protein
MKKRAVLRRAITLLVIAVGLGLLLLGGCRKSEPKAATAAAAKKYTIGVSIQGSNNDWAASCYAHFKYAFGTKYADKIANVYYGESGYDDKKQIADIEDLLTKNLDLLIVQPVSETSAAGVIEKAKAAGVKVVIFGGLCGTDQYDAYVDRDHIKTGYAFADWVAKKIGGKGNVVVIMGYPGSGYSNNVLKGVQDALKNYPDIKVLGTEYAFYTPAESKKIIESYFAKRVQIDGVIVDGGLMDFGVLDAFVDAKKTLPPTTADDWFGFLKKTRSLDYTNYMVVNSGEELSLDTADVAMKLLAGESVPKDDLRPPTIWEGTDLAAKIDTSLPDSYWLASQIPADRIPEFYK